MPDVCVATKMTHTNASHICFATRFLHVLPQLQHNDIDSKRSQIYLHEPRWELYREARSQIYLHEPRWELYSHYYSLDYIPLTHSKPNQTTRKPVKNTQAIKPSYF